MLDAIHHLESVVLEASGIEGIVLRYGAFYGPGTSIALGGHVVEDVRRRHVPIVGNGKGVWSFIHIDDAAQGYLGGGRARLAGIYNIVDDEPAPVLEWLPELAAAIGAPPPHHVPAFVGRLAVGEQGVVAMTNSADALMPRQNGSWDGSLSGRVGGRASAAGWRMREELVA